MSRDTADNRATADDAAERALVRYADILDGRKRLATFRIKGQFHDIDGNIRDVLFYKNENGLLPPEIESSFAEACDEIRRCGNAALASIVTLLHEDLAAKFSATALLYQEAVQLEREGVEKAKRREEKRVEFLNYLLQDCPKNIWDLPTDQISEAWREIEDVKRTAEVQADSWVLDTFCNLELCVEGRFIPSRKRLEECFEQNIAIVRGIVKAGVRDIHGEKLEQIIAGIRLVNQAQAETKQAVVEVRKDVRKVKKSAKGAEQVAKENKSMFEATFSKLPEGLKRKTRRSGKRSDPLRKRQDDMAYSTWLDFQSGMLDQELEYEVVRVVGGKRTHEEFFTVCKNKKIYNGAPLKNLYSSVEEMKAAFERVAKRRNRALKRQAEEIEKRILQSENIIMDT